MVDKVAFVKILLIEDDLDLGNGVRIALADQGLDVIWVRRKEDALHQLAVCAPELILLDLGLPDGDGMSLMTRLRQQLRGMPVIILTARGTLQDRLCGLDAGADDYLVKPFDLEELSARVRAALRRSAAQASPLWRHGPVAIDPIAKRVTLNDKPVAVTAREFAVLQALMHHPTHILSRAQLEEALYGWSEEVESNAIEVHIYNLRKKLGSDFIVTVRNQGYVLAPA